ncbi:MAG: hypothetical protein NVSMB4_07130 [Acidimicrobiales bacterium]
MERRIEQATDQVLIDLDATFSADPVAAVMAHGALNSMTVVCGTLSLLATSGHDLDDAQRTTLLRDAARHAELVTALLHDLVSGLPLGATAILQDLDQQARERHR